MDNIIVLLIVAVIIAVACTYIYRAKKSGKKCIGCPDADKCSKGETLCTGCQSCSGCEK